MSLPLVAQPFRIDRIKAWCADLGLVATVACVIALCAMSATLLENLGYHYEMPGGLPWEKFHPATLLAGAALALRLAAAPRPGSAAHRVLAEDPALSLHLLAVGIAAAHAALVAGLPVTGLIDTFVLPAMLVPVFGDLRADLRRRLALLVCVLLAANALIALIELLSGWRLVPVALPEGAAYDPTDYRQVATTDWRSTAMLGHPLQNAVITGVFILCLASRGCAWLAPRVRLFLIALCLCAMVAFGGRASLVLVLVALCLFGLTAAVRRVMAGQPMPTGEIAVVFLAVPFLAVAVALAAQGGFFDRLIERFIDDQGSANARLLMWDLFTPLSWTDIMFGPDPAVVQLNQHLLGIDLGIESFWVSLTLAHGLIVATVLFCGVALLCWRLIASGAIGAVPILLYFFTVASTSTSLSSKTTSLGLVTMLILVLLERPAARRGQARVAGP